MEDSFYLATGRQLWDASLITAPTLVLASERDFWSRPQDRELLQEHLTHAAKVKVVVLKGATHFVHLDRPVHGRQTLVDEVVDFLNGH
jgi:pimeloyl-ACP methyl ester carboxylesterase